MDLIVEKECSRLSTENTFRHVIEEFKAVRWRSLPDQGSKWNHIWDKEHVRKKGSKMENTLKNTCKIKLYMPGVMVQL